MDYSPLRYSSRRSLSLPIIAPRGFEPFSTPSSSDSRAERPQLSHLTFACGNPLLFKGSARVSKVLIFARVSLLHEEMPLKRHWSLSMNDVGVYHKCMVGKSYSALDREIVTLAAVWDLIDSMVHYGHFESNHRIENTELMFKTREASKLFLIILADFLSLPRDGTFGLTKPPSKGSMGDTYLGHLQCVVEKPQLDGDYTLLASSTKAFADWLDGVAVVENVWLPSIEREGTLRVRRMDYLKICGTISKHGFTRLGRIVHDIRMILADNGTDIDEGQSYLIIPEFQEWFQHNIFIASSTQIAWHLNEIRWAIYKYLLSEFHRAYMPTETIQGLQMYKYDVPPEITNPLIKSIYWELMNDVRSRPYFPRFTIDRYTRRY